MTPQIGNSTIQMLPRLPHYINVGGVSTWFPAFVPRGRYLFEAQTTLKRRQSFEFRVDPMKESNNNNILGIYHTVSSRPSTLK